MARTRATIWANIWRNDDFTRLTEQAQRTYLFLLSQPKLTLAGCLDIIPERWAKSSANSTPETIQAGLDELAEHNFIVVDRFELVIRTFVSNDLCAGTINRNILNGMWSAWEAIESDDLRQVIVDNAPDQAWTWKGVTPPKQALAMRCSHENHGSNCGSNNHGPNHSPNHLSSVVCHLESAICHPPPTRVGTEPTPETDTPADDEDGGRHFSETENSTLTEILDHCAKLRMEYQLSTGTQVVNRRGYLAKIRETIAEELGDQAEAAIARYDEPPRAIAEYLVGGRDPRHFNERPEAQAADHARRLAMAGIDLNNFGRFGD